MPERASAAPDPPMAWVSGGGGWRPAAEVADGMSDRRLRAAAGCDIDIMIWSRSPQSSRPPRSPAAAAFNLESWRRRPDCSGRFQLLRSPLGCWSIPGGASYDGLRRGRTRSRLLDVTTTSRNSCGRHHFSGCPHRRSYVIDCSWTRSPALEKPAPVDLEHRCASW